MASETQESTALIEPFERFQRGYRTRPLVYFLQHRVLPEMVNANHPELARLLAPEPVRGMAFLYAVSRTVSLLEMNAIWPQGTAHSPAGFAYLTAIMKSLVSSPTARGNWIIESEGATYPLEAVLIGIFRDTTADTNEYVRASPPATIGPWVAPAGARHNRSRYFTLERTRDPDNFAFCEWSNGRHGNFGFTAHLSIDEFESRFMERCA